MALKYVHFVLGLCKYQLSSNSNEEPTPNPKLPFSFYTDQETLIEDSRCIN